jgi:hypothetical protein
MISINSKNKVDEWAYRFPDVYSQIHVAETLLAQHVSEIPNDCREPLRLTRSEL